MPSKRRGVRNGTAQSGKPLANIAAVAAAQQRQANIQQQQQQQQHNQHNKHRAGAGGNSNSSSSSAMDHHHHQQQCSTDGGECANDNNDSAPLTLKQQQQLERNQFLVALTKDQLRVECRKRGQKTNGNKTELVFRIQYTQHTILLLVVFFVCAVIFISLAVNTFCVIVLRVFASTQLCCCS